MHLSLYTGPCGLKKEGGEEGEGGRTRAAFSWAESRI